MCSAPAVDQEGVLAAACMPQSGIVAGSNLSTVSGAGLAMESTLGAASGAAASSPSFPWGTGLDMQACEQVP